MPCYRPLATRLPLLAVALVVGCSSSTTELATTVDTGPLPTSTPGVDETIALFEPDHLIEVRIELPAADWDTLVGEGRSLARAIAGCPEAGFEYTWFQATVTIDGQTYPQVGVRKKGFLGSLSTLRPSLKLHFARSAEHEGRTHAGMRRLTLNNDRQDPSHTHQCMSYALFRKAGLPAPRCNHAHVVVNGLDLGIYSHVEAVKKPMLARHFSSDDGNLYEANARADFAPALAGLYERKTNELDESGQPASRADLDAVIEALQAGDDSLEAALDAVIDLDAYFSFWAMEVLTGHWDGHTGDRNNHFIYADPATGRFTFIPWGTDGTFRSGHAFLPATPASVYAWAAIAYRLYAHPTLQDRYLGRLRHVLQTVWDTDVLLAEVDRIGALTGADAEALDEQRDFIAQRSAALLADLDATPAKWPYPLYVDLPTCKEPTPVQGTFRAVWGEDPWDIEQAPASLELELEGVLPPFLFVGTAAGPGDDGLVAINLWAKPTLGDALIVSLRVPPHELKVGTIAFHGFETFGLLLRETAPKQWENVSFIGGGQIVFESVGTAAGDVIEGTFQGSFSAR